MNNYIKYMLLTILILFPVQAYAGHEGMAITDNAASALFSFVDLRDRETYVQVTNVDDETRTMHVQIFNVDDNCNENNFFDVYTPNDTHIYNMRDILTNDGNPSGVVLPENAYGFVVISALNSNGSIDPDLLAVIGNFRIIDDTGYEYRTNSAGFENDREVTPDTLNFNFSTKNGVILSDVVFIAASFEQSDGEWLAGPLEAHYAVDVDIFDVNENPLSCRDVIFACVDQEHPLLEELLEDVAGDDDDDDTSSANVAAFEYGINEAILHSRGGELLCPGNVISEGWVFLDEEESSDTNDSHGFFIGLNNGNGRGSMDSMWRPNFGLRPDED